MEKEEGDLLGNPQGPCPLAIAMNKLKKAHCRLYQKTFYVLQTFLRIEEPERVKDDRGIYALPSYLKKKGFINPLIVTGKYYAGHPIIKKLEEEFAKEKMGVAFYYGVIPNPTFDEVYAGKMVAKENNCDSVVGIGGGSTLDVAKLIGALLANPKGRLDKMKGLLKVHKSHKMVVAVPTTCGSGSSASYSAVIINPKTREKFAVNDPKLAFKAVIMDDSLLLTLSQKTIAETGMDALTHAIESYIGHAKRKRSKHCAISATRLIAENIALFYNDSNNEKARKNMLEASYLAGYAFSRSYVGYVHALSHALSGKYDLPHGYTNAVLLPYVLKEYGSSVYTALARLSDAIQLTPYSRGEEEKAKAFIAYIEELNKKMGIPTDFKGIIEEKDIPELALTAAKEANPLYPVPVEMDEDELAAIYRKVI